MKFYFNLAVQAAIVGCLCLISGFAYSATYSSTLSATPLHKTCYTETYSVNYVATITPTNPTTYVYGTDYSFNLSQTTFNLRTTASGANGTVLATNTGGTASNSTISGSFNMSSLAIGVYTIYASITIVDLNGGRDVITTPIATFTIGYQTTWSQMTDMQADPNSYSAKRNILTPGQTFANAISANMIPSGTAGWIELGTQFTTATGTVYCVIGSSTTSITNPTSQPLYLSFTRTGASSIQVMLVINGSNSYGLSGVTYGQPIRIIRASNGAITFKRGNSETSIGVSGNPTVNYTGDLNVGVFVPTTNGLGNGFTNIITSNSCIFDNQYYFLKDEVDESMAYVSGSKLKIKFEEDYFDNAGTLTYSIQCLNDDSTPSTSTVAKTKHENWLNIPLTGLVNGNIYLVTVKDTKGRVKYLKFKKV